jgi:UDP-N-acetylmuramate dehydrogenase
LKRLIDFSSYSSLKIGSKVEVNLIDELISLPKNAFIIGGANNILLSNNPPPLYMLSKKFSYIDLVDDRLIIGGAFKSGQINSFCKKHDIGGFEYLSKLPGTLGGLIAMNAGMKDDEIFNSLIDIKTQDARVKKEDIKHGYRFSKLSGIVYEATFKIQKPYSQERVELFSKMRGNQPKEPSAGSVFKNPDGDYAGRVIEAVGLKGYQKGAAMFSEIHSNFLINLGGATFDDAKFLIDEAKRRVEEKFGIILENEVQIV